MIHRRACWTLPWLGAAALTACRWLPRVPAVPIPLIRQPLTADTRAPMLVVMLPGAYSLPGDFIGEGFVGTLRARGFAADALLADAHMGYAENGTLLERLHDDVLAPAQRAGYRRIWLVGISLGGFASLGLLRRHPEAIEGVLAIAPYVGQPALVQQVAAAGGAEAYARSARDDSLEGGLWSWLGRSPAQLRDKIHLYTGSQDRFITGQRLFAARLAADHVLELPGDHDWPVWKALWARWLSGAPWPHV